MAAPAEQKKSPEGLLRGSRGGSDQRSDQKRRRVEEWAEGEEAGLSVGDMATHMHENDGTCIRGERYEM